MNLSFLQTRRNIIIAFLALCILGILAISPSQPGVHVAESSTAQIFDRQVWALYIGSWGNLETDKRWVRWRYRANKYFGDYYEPPGRVNVPLYPQLGLYSSHDNSTLLHHCYQMKSAGIDAVILQWWSSNSSDEIDEDANGFTDRTFELLLDAAQQFGMKATVQIQPYEGRSNSSIVRDVSYLIDKYSSHPAFLKAGEKPVIMFYEPHGIQNVYSGINLLRSNGHNGFFIASIVDRPHVASDLEDGFDGIYTYFASEGFTWGSNITNWKFLASDCKERGLTFIPAVGPGYNDGKFSHWEKDSRRNRESGMYYQRMWTAAIRAASQVVVVNSFNNWYEGTMIEPAISRENKQYTDDNWAVGGSPDTYVKMTRENSAKFKAKGEVSIE